MEREREERRERRKSDHGLTIAFLNVSCSYFWFLSHVSFPLCLNFLAFPPILFPVFQPQTEGYTLECPLSQWSKAKRKGRERESRFMFFSSLWTFEYEEGRILNQKSSACEDRLLTSSFAFSFSSLFSTTSFSSPLIFDDFNFCAIVVFNNLIITTTTTIIINPSNHRLLLNHLATKRLLKTTTPTNCTLDCVCVFVPKLSIADSVYLNQSPTLCAWINRRLCVLESIVQHSTYVQRIDIVRRRN